MKAWILFALGTLAYFLIRYSRRRNKLADFDFKFWLKDNWPELSVVLILDVAVMIIFMDADTNITEWLTTFLPKGIAVSAKLVTALACGLGLGKGVYEVFRKKLKKTPI
jgi:flagellar biosynthesis protein FliQ